MSTREDIAKEAAAEGAQARRDGRNDNPHPPGTLDWWAWEQGWAAEDRFIKGREQDDDES